MGNRSPIRPVEQTATSMAPVSVPQPLMASATASAVACASWNPPGPVQAFAPPELRITARSLPVDKTCRLHNTGAALTLFSVNTPAASYSGPSLNTNARSSLPLALIPAAMPAARKPEDAVTPCNRVIRCPPATSRQFSGEATESGSMPLTVVSPLLMAPHPQCSDPLFRPSPEPGSWIGPRRRRCLW